MATYYINPAPLGNNANDGSAGAPWLTLRYACTQAVTVGDIIHVNAGSYIETVQSVVAPGVNIEGEGDTSIIVCHLAGDPQISLTSVAEGTNGNQKISRLKLDGDGYTGHSGIGVYRRSNVEIDSVNVYDFKYRGILFSGTATSNTEPLVYSTNNYVHDCYIYDSAYEFGGGLQIGGQKDMMIQNNSVILPARAGNAGMGIKLYSGGYLQGITIDNCTVTVPPKGASTWEFAIELWTTRGGIEIKNCRIKGTLDISTDLDINSDEIAANDAGGYGFAARIHHNTFGQDALEANTVRGIDIEHSFSGGIYIYNNDFSKIPYGIAFAPIAASVQHDVYIYYNIFNDVGRSDSNFAFAIRIPGTTNTEHDNINIWNNVFKAQENATIPAIGISILDVAGSNFSIKNNISVGFTNYWMQLSGSTIDIISVQNNCAFGNGHANAFEYATSTLTNLINSGNITDDPLFVSSGTDFSLQDLSPCINTGLNVGLLTDFVGTLVPFGSAPDIGAYEWWEITPEPPPSYTNITLVNTPACYNAVDNTIVSRWVATECPINFTLLRRDWYITSCAEIGGFLAVSIYGSFSGNDGDVISVYDLTTNSMYTGTITDKSGDPVLITDIPYVSGMDIKYLNDHTLYAGYYFEGRLTINGVVESLTVIASPDSFGYADLDVSGILRIKTSIGKVTNYLSLIQKDTNKSGHFTLEYRGCWYGSNEAWISEGSTTSPASEVIWYYAECVRSEEQGCNLAEYVPTDLNDAPFLNQFDTPVYWYGLPFDLSFILPERAELSPTSDIIVTMKVYNSANVQMGADIVQTIDVDSLEGYVNSLNINSTLIDAGAAYFTVEIFSM